MPRRNTSSGWLPKLTHLKSKQIGRVRIPGKKDIYFGPVGVWPANQRKPPKSVEDAYREAIADWLASGGEQVPPAVEVGDAPILAEVVAAYLLFVEKNYRKRGKPTAVLNQTTNAVRYVLPLFAELPAADFGSKQWRQVRDAMLKNPDLSGETIQTYAGRLRALFSWAAHEGMVPEETADVVHATKWFGRGVKAPNRWKPRQPVPEKDFAAALPKLSPAVQAILRLQRLTGMRPREACYVRSGDITDIGDGLWIYQARDDCNKLAHRGIPKIVRLGPKSQVILLPFLTAARQRGEDTWLFTNRLGKPYETAYLDNLVKTACEAAGVTAFTAGRLRHTRGSEIEKHYGKEGAQAQLGHTNSQMTGRYTSSARDEVREELLRKIARESG